ncbi:MAG: NADH-quinone oxidoreductase subunit J [Omnitrophica WOR_2 bacterium]
MNFEFILFIFLAIGAVAAALAMLFARNAVYSALFLIVNFSTIAVLYLLLDAPFIAMAQITVYAGAIMVLFLFVIMLLGAEQLRRAPTNPWQLPAAIFLSLLLLVEVAYVIVTRGGRFPAVSATLQSFGDPVSIGKLLFGQYLLPFEITSVLLLVAMIGAIVLTQSDRRR